MLCKTTCIKFSMSFCEYWMQMNCIVLPLYLVLCFLEQNCILSFISFVLHHLWPVPAEETNRSFVHSASVSLNNHARVRLGWTFSDIYCMLVHPDLDSVPLFVEMQERFIFPSRAVVLQSSSHELFMLFCICLCMMSDVIRCWMFTKTVV